MNHTYKERTCLGYQNVRDNSRRHALDIRKMNGTDAFSRSRGLTRGLRLVMRDGRRDDLVLLGAPGGLRVLIIGVVSHDGGSRERGV